MTKHNHITRDIKPLGECPSCDEYHDKHIQTIDKYEPEYGTMKRSGVGQYVRLFDYRTLEGELHELKAKYDFQHLVKENDRLKAENQKLKSEFNEIWTPAFGELKSENEYLNSHAIESKKVIAKLEAEIVKLREQVKDYEVALKECEDVTFLAADNGNIVHWKPAREVLKKWGEL